MAQQQRYSSQLLPHNDAIALNVDCGLGATQTDSYLHENVNPWANTRRSELSSGSESTPPYFRVTTTVFPKDSKTAAESCCPLGLVVTPGLVGEVPVVDHSESAVPTCRHCQAYLCPYTPILTDGYRYTCPFCRKDNDARLTGETVPLNTRKEVTEPVCDMLLGPESSNIASFCFVVDASSAAVASGFTRSFVSNIAACSVSMKGSTRVALVMVVGVCVSVFDLERCAERVVPDVVDGNVVGIVKLVELDRVRDNFAKVLKVISDRKVGEGGSLIVSGMEVARDLLAEKGGIMCVGTVDVPESTPGRDSKKAGQVGSSSLMSLASEESRAFYGGFAFSCNKMGVSCHVFSATHKLDSCGLSAMALPVGLTGGTAHFYGNFSVANHEKLYDDLFNVLTGNYMWNCSMNLRCSLGVTMSGAHGNMTIDNGACVFPVLHERDSVAFELAVSQVVGPYFLAQLAVVWTDELSRRKLRLFTFKFPISSNSARVNSFIDEGAMATVLAKRVVFDVLNSGVERASFWFNDTVVAVHAGGARFRSLYHLAHSIARIDLLQEPHPNGVDGKAAQIIWLRSCNITETLLFLYPRMIALDTRINDLPCDILSLDRGRVFLFQTNTCIMILVHKDVDVAFFSNVFGLALVDDAFPVELPVLENDDAKYVSDMVDNCRALVGHFVPVELIWQGGPREHIIQSLLVDTPGERHGLVEWKAQVLP